MKTKLMKPKIWLIVIALLHLFMGVIGSYMTMGGSIENIAVFLYMGTLSISLLYVALMTKGQTQARLAVVLCAPIAIWFIIGIVMKLKFLGYPVAEMPSGLLPLTLWSMPAITGAMNWNSD